MQLGRGFQVPSIDTRNVTTQIAVNNGDTAVIGGIYEETLRNEVDKVPWLGDLPLLGYLFKTTTKSSEKTELLIFLTPRIVKESVTASDEKGVRGAGGCSNAGVAPFSSGLRMRPLRGASRRASGSQRERWGGPSRSRGKGYATTSVMPPASPAAHALDASPTFTRMPRARSAIGAGPSEADRADSTGAISVAVSSRRKSPTSTMVGAAPPGQSLSRRPHGRRQVDARAARSRGGCTCPSSTPTSSSSAGSASRIADDLRDRGRAAFRDREEAMIAELTDRREHRARHRRRRGHARGEAAAA